MHCNSFCIVGDTMHTEVTTYHLRKFMINDFEYKLVIFHKFEEGLTLSLFSINLVINKWEGSLKRQKGKTLSVQKVKSNLCWYEKIPFLKKI